MQWCKFVIPNNESERYSGILAQLRLYSEFKVTASCEILPVEAKIMKHVLK